MSKASRSVQAGSGEKKRKAKWERQQYANMMNAQQNQYMNDLRARASHPRDEPLPPIDGGQLVADPAPEPEEVKALPKPD